MLLAKIIYQDLLPVEILVTFDIPYKTEYYLWHTIAKNASIYKSHLAHFHSRARKKNQKVDSKKMFIFREMELSCFNIKKTPIFSRRKTFVIFWKT